MDVIVVTKNLAQELEYLKGLQQVVKKGGPKPIKAQKLVFRRIRKLGKLPKPGETLVVNIAGQSQQVTVGHVIPSGKQNRQLAEVHCYY